MYGLEGEYILSVGTIEPRKNLAILAQAWDMVRSRLGSMLLVIIGGIKSHFQKSYIPDPATDILVLNSVPDEHLPALYAGASAFIYPSLYEGFGLPILEAMACGTPVISSNRTALPEAVGSAGILVDPEDSSHLAETILSTIQNPELKAHLRSLGLERVREFTWEQTAGRIWDAVLSLSSLDPA